MKIVKNLSPVLLHCTFTMDRQHKSVVKSMNKRRWLHLLVNSYNCKLLMRSKRQFLDNATMNPTLQHRIAFQKVVRLSFKTNFEWERKETRLHWNWFLDFFLEHLWMKYRWITSSVFPFLNGAKSWPKTWKHSNRMQTARLPTIHNWTSLNMWGSCGKGRYWGEGVPIWWGPMHHG